MRLRTDAPSPTAANNADNDEVDAGVTEARYNPRLSKTQQKTQMHELQQLGEEVAALPDSRLAAAAMPDALREAIAQYRRTKSHEGRRRQLQYIGKQMRLADAEPLREAVASFKLGSARDTLLLHQAELWRDELIADDAAATRWARTFPESDLQHLRSLVRAARKDAADASQPRHGHGFRELFQFVKPWLK